MQISNCKSTSWTIENTAEFFHCKVYTIHQAIALKAEQGVLAKPTTVSTKGMDKDAASLVHAFYEDEEFTRVRKYGPC